VTALVEKAPECDACPTAAPLLLPKKNAEFVLLIVKLFVITPPDNGKKFNVGELNILL
jgi:hypothetical protein